MKKIIVAMATMTAVFSTYGAIVGVDWLATGGFYFNANPSTGMLSPTNTTIAQLIYSVDNVVNPATIGGGVSGDDVLLSQVNVSTVWADFSGPAYSAVTNPLVGFVYARIFQDNTVQQNDWYYYTVPMALADRTNPTVGDPQLSNQTIEMNTDTTNGNAIDVGSTVAQVVPEPATFLLFGMGGMGAWLLRRRSRISK